MSWAVDCRTHGLDTHANRPWQRRPGLQAPAIRWQPEELLLVSGCSGHADRSGPDVDAAASCSYLSDCMSLSGHRHLLRALCWLAWCSRQTSGARLDRTRRGRCGAAVGNIGAPAAAQRLWFWCKPLGYRQDRLEMRLNQPHDRMPPLRVPILTKMVVSASVASVLMRSVASVLMRWLLIAALTASTHGNRPWQRRPGLCKHLHLPFDGSQRS